MSTAPTINIQVPRATRDRIGQIADENGGLKLLAVVGILVRGWDLLNPDQQREAICHATAGDAGERLARPLANKPTADLRSVSARLVAVTAGFNEAVVDGLADGELDARERRQLRGVLKQVLAHVDGAAQLAKC